MELKPKDSDTKYVNCGPKPQQLQMCDECLICIAEVHYCKVCNKELMNNILVKALELERMSHAATLEQTYNEGYDRGYTTGINYGVHKDKGC